MPFPLQVVHLARPPVAPQHANQPPQETNIHLVGSSEAEMAVEHCSDGAGTVSGDDLPRAAGCCSVSGFD